MKKNVVKSYSNTILTEKSCRNYLIVYLYEAVRLVKEWENFKRMVYSMSD